MDDTSENSGCITPKRIFGALALWAFVLFLGLAGAGYWWASETGLLASSGDAPDSAAAVEPTEVEPEPAETGTDEAAAADEAPTAEDAELPGDAAEADLSASADLSLSEEPAEDAVAAEDAAGEDQGETQPVTDSPEVIEEIERSEPPPREAPSARSDAEEESQAERDARRRAEREERDARRATEAEERRRAEELEAERAAEREAREERARESELEPDREPEREREPEPEESYGSLKISSRLVDGPPRIKAKIEGDPVCNYELRIEIIRVNAAGNVVGEPKRMACPVTADSNPACELKVQTAWMAGGAKISVSTWAAKHKSCPAGAPTPKKKKREYGG